MTKFVHTLLKLGYHVIIPLFFTLGALVLFWNLAQEWESPIFDRLMRLSAKPAHENSPVIIVTLDDVSISNLSKQFGPLPWSKKQYLQIFDAIQAYNPALLVFDSYISANTTRDRQALMDQLAQRPRFITGMVLHPKRTEHTLLPEFASLKMGAVNTTPDMKDGIVRRIEPYQGHHINEFGGLYPALSLTTVFEYLNTQFIQPDKSTEIIHWAVRTKDAPHTQQHQFLGLNFSNLLKNHWLWFYPEQYPDKGFGVALEDSGSMLLRWYRLQKPTSEQGNLLASHETIPLWLLLQSNPRTQAVLKNKLKDKIVLLGSSSTLHRDYHHTPMTPYHLGADIHATAIDNLIFGESLVVMPAWVQWLVLLMMAGMGFMVRSINPKLTGTVLYTICIMVVYLWAAFMLLKHAQIVLDIVTPEMFFVVGLLGGVIANVLLRDRQVEQLEKTISQLVSSSVFETIKRQGNILTQGGQRVEVTSMFVDIRDFTTIAEGLPPSDLTRLLNHFYESIERVVFKHHGTLDKYMGDGILFLFGAPLHQPGHAHLALAAARDLLCTIDELKTFWQDIVPGLEVGISINSGEAFVGFLGPAHNLQFTGVGDTVNTCVRLQEFNKRYGLRVIMGQPTINSLMTITRVKHDGEEDETVYTRPEDIFLLGTVFVRGRQSSLDIYSLECCVSEDLKTQILLERAVLEASGSL